MKKRLVIYLCLTFSYILLYYTLFLNYSHIKEFIFVSSFFKNEKIVEHTFNDYVIWNKNLLRIINKSIIIFTDYSEEAKQILRGYKNIVTIKYNSIWDVPCYNSLTKKNYEKLLVNDPYKHVHNPFLYAVYNAKIWFLDKSTSIVNSKIYIWIDIGCIRGKIDISSFPDKRSMKYLSELNSMFFFVINNKKFNDINQDKMICERFIEGGSYGGSKQNIKGFNNLFWKIHNYYLYRNNCLYDDQNLLLTTIFKYKRVILFNVVNKVLCTKSLWMKFICFYYNMSRYRIKDENIGMYKN